MAQVGEGSSEERTNRNLRRREEGGAAEGGGGAEGGVRSSHPEASTVTDLTVSSLTGPSLNQAEFI